MRIFLAMASAFAVALFSSLTSPSSSADEVQPAFNRPPLVEKEYASLPLGRVTARGWLEVQLRLMADGLTGDLDEVYPSVVGSRNGWRGGDGDGWERGPYWIDGLLPLAHLLDDAELKVKAQPWIEWTLNNQAADGYIGPVPFAEPPAHEPGLQRGMRRDWWPKMVMLKILRNHYSATGDERVLDVLDRYFRYQLEELPKTPLGHYTFWAHERGGDNLDVVLWLYNITGKPYLLELAELIHQQTFDHTRRWLSDDSPLLRREGMHCVNIAQGLKHPVVYSQVDGQDVHLKAVRKAFKDLDELYGHPTGLFGGDELLNSKKATTGSEFCTAAEMLLSLERIAEITGDVAMLDRLERIAFNVVPTHTTDDIKLKQYYSTVNQIHLTRRTKRAHINDHDGTDTVYGVLTGYPCCLTNFHQALPKLTQHAWMASVDGGLAALYYVPCQVTQEIGGQMVTIEEETNYPLEDQIRMTVRCGQPIVFPIDLRIPTWCDSPSIKVNGQPVSDLRPGTTTRIDRQWNDGDKVVLDLPASLKTSRWYQNSVAIERGPLLFALKIDNKTEMVENDDQYDDYLAVHPTSPWNYGILESDLADLDKHFKLIRSFKPDPSNPWTEATAPLTIHARGVRIEDWKETENHIAGELSISPVKVANATPEPITLIPYGCTMLRVAEFPVVGDGPSATPWVDNGPRMMYRAEASHCNSGDTVDAIADNVEPDVSNDTSIDRMTFWDHLGTKEWVTANVDQPRLFDEVSVYWFDDRGFGQCRVPESWQVFYRSDGQWIPAKTTQPYGVLRDQYNTVSFDQVTTDAIKIEVQLQSGFSGGILEAQVYKSSR